MGYLTDGERTIPGPVPNAMGSSAMQCYGSGSQDPNGTTQGDDESAGQDFGGQAGGGCPDKMFYDPTDVHDPGMIKGKKKSKTMSGNFGSKPPTMAQRNATAAAQRTAKTATPPGAPTAPPKPVKAPMKRSKS
jgi:hypothetical protein